MALSRTYACRGTHRVSSEHLAKLAAAVTYIHNTRNLFPHRNCFRIVTPFMLSNGHHQWPIALFYLFLTMMSATTVVRFTCEQKWSADDFTSGPGLIAKGIYELQRPVMRIYEAILLQKYMNKAKNYFEYGMGGSTRIACEVASSNKQLTITSVDNVQEWVDHVSTLNCSVPLDLKYVDLGVVGEWGTTANVSAIGGRNYVRAIENTQGKLFDMVLVDGRYRVACALSALLISPLDKVIAFHDFARTGYQHVLKYADVVECAVNLVVLRRKQDMSTQLQRELEEDILRYMKKQF